jgi:glutamate 5-kinase
VARGLTEYGADEASLILGLRSDAIQARLGYRGAPVLIHRDDLVLTS